MPRPNLWIVALLALAAAGCNESKSTSSSTTTESATSGSVTPSETAATPASPLPGQAVPADVQLVTTASGLQYYDLAVGNGDIADTGEQVTVHYTGWLANGTEFDSSLRRQEPIRFPLGTGAVIKGWDEGLTGMRVGGKRKLIIPANLAYGADGRAPVIPPDANLVFDVELVEVK